MHKQLNSISFLSGNSGFSDLQSSSIIQPKSIDHNPELIQQLFETKKLEKTKNIFQDPLNLKILQHDPAIGPKYEKNKIIQRTIVGKPDIFKRKQLIQHIHSNQDLQNPIQQINLQESINLSKKESPIQKRLTQLKFAQSPIKITKQTKMENLITGSELINKISQLEKRFMQNKVDEQKLIENMPFQKKQSLYREQRALEDFDQKEKIHSELLHSLSARISRNPSTSLMMDLYNFRKKQEYSSIIHLQWRIIISFYRLFYKLLNFFQFHFNNLQLILIFYYLIINEKLVCYIQKYQNINLIFMNNQHKIIIYQNIYYIDNTNDKMNQLSDNKNQQIIEMQEQNQVPFFICSDRQQIIRKPYIFEKDQTISTILKQLNEDKTFQSFTTNNVLKEKELKYKSLAKDKIKFNIDELMIFGQSKYEQEISIDPHHKYLIRDIEKQLVNEDEIL